MSSVTTLAASELNYHGATLNGTSEGYDLSPQYTAVGFDGYYDGQDPEDAVIMQQKYWELTGTFSTTRTTLASNIKYYYRAHIRINGIYYYANNWVEFTTPSVLATLTTYSVQNIVATTATGRGFASTTTFGSVPNVTGGENLTKRGVCWNITGNPTVADNIAEEEGDFGHGAFTVPMTGLPPGTLIYVKAYGYNSIGYAYGAEVEFTTLAAVEVTTELPTQVGIDHAKGNGTASGENITERGFEVKLAFSGSLGKAINYSIAGFKGDLTWDIANKWHGDLVKTVTETGSFIAESFVGDLGRFPIAVVSDKLFANETYNYIAYAIIDGVTYYGDWVEFTTASYPVGEGPNDVISPSVPIIEPVVTEDELLEPWELEWEWPEIIFPEWEDIPFDMPPFELDIDITFGRIFGAYMRKLDTKKDWETLREKCIIYQENMNQFTLTVNHNTLVLKNLVNDIITYIDGDVYPSDLKLMNSSQQLTPLYLEPISPDGFKDIINDFRFKDVCNVFELNQNFIKILNSLNSLYESDKRTEPISYNTREYIDIQPTAKRMILQLEDMRKKTSEVQKLVIRNIKRIFTYV